MLYNIRNKDIFKDNSLFGLRSKTRFKDISLLDSERSEVMAGEESADVGLGVSVFITVAGVAEKAVVKEALAEEAPVL